MHTKEEQEDRATLPIERVTAENWVRAVREVATKQTNAVIVAKVIDLAKHYQLENPK